MLALHPAQRCYYFLIASYLRAGEPVIDRPVAGKLEYGDTRIGSIV